MSKQNERPIFKGPIEIETEVHDGKGSFTTHKIKFTYEFFGDKEAIAGPDDVRHVFNTSHSSKLPSTEVEIWMVAYVRSHLLERGYHVENHAAHLQATKSLRVKG